MCSCQRHGEDCVGSQVGLVFSTVQFDHFLVEHSLVADIHAPERIVQRRIDVTDRIQDTLAEVAAVITITQFQCLA